MLLAHAFAQLNTHVRLYRFDQNVSDRQLGCIMVEPRGEPWRVIPKESCIRVQIWGFAFSLHNMKLCERTGKRDQIVQFCSLSLYLLLAYD